MQALSTPPSAIHYHIPGTVLTPTAEKVMAISPEVVLGVSGLFRYDSEHCSVTLSPSFHELLKETIRRLN